MNLNIPIPDFICDWPFYAGVVLGIIIGLFIGTTILLYILGNLIGPFK